MSKQNIEDIYQLSPGQQGMLTVVLLAGPGSEVYFDQSTLTLSGELDVALWRRAWQRVLDRHPALRTLFIWERQGDPLQVVRRQVELPWQELDLRGLSPAEREERLEDFLRQDRARGFDLGTPPLMRLALIRWEEETWKMVWSFHHLIVDGWSLPCIFGEAVTCYAAFREGREPDLEPARRYRDYVAWLQRQDLGRAEAFWRGALAGFDEPTPLPYDGTGLGTGSRTFGREVGWIPPAETEALAALARRHQLTLNTLFQGAWGALLARATGRDDVIFGSVVSGRPGEVEGIESVVGFFINVLPVRLRIGSETVGTALTDLQRRQAEQRDFEYCPLETIQAWSGLPRGSRQIESLLVFQNLPLNPLEVASLPGFRVLGTQTKGATHYPVTLYVAPRAGGFDLRLDYHVSRLDAASAGRLLAHLRALLAAFATQLEARMTELPLITAEEQLHLLAQAAGAEALPAGLCIHTLFEEQAARTPEAPAVEAGAMTLTYRELNERAESLARRLRRLGVGPESIVGLRVERSPEMVVGMLAVLKAGGAYLPLDPAYPQERLAFMVEDSGARVVLTRESLTGSAGDDGEPDAWDPAPLPGMAAMPAMPANTAYVIYTSGSTGRPKGVLVSHAALVGYVQSAGEDAGIGAGDRVLQFASMSFDTSAEEIYPCLTRGATLVLRDDAMAGAAESFLREVERLSLTVLDLPTAYWHELVDGMATDGIQWPACVRLAILGGEQAREDRLDVWRERVGERCRLLNTYGPTEATIVTTRRDLNGPRDFPAAVPIGRPVPGARVHVVSRDLDLLPAGLDGELVIGGAGLARGYLGRPDLTAERFVPDPFAGSPGERLYRTGDLARWLPAGELEFRGRVDHQVKVRGFRVELGEIESALRRLAGVREAAVVVREEAPGERRIVAYVVSAHEVAPSMSELRSRLRELLPEYMLPAAFVILEALPLTPSGKIDRRALPAPDVVRADAVSAAPRTPMEELLGGVWSDLLGTSAVAPHDSFFDLGGHSLLATRMISRVRSVLGVELPMRAIFEQPTLSGFAALTERARQGDAGPELPPLVRVPRSGPLPPSFAQQRLWFLAKLDPASYAYNLTWVARLVGSLDVAALAAALTAIVCRHESLRTTFGEEDGQPLQVIAEPAPHPLPVVDLTGLPAAEQEGEARRIAAAEARRPYDLAVGPLVRSALLRLDEREHVLLTGMHHVISDGWSMGIFVRELGVCYRASVAGEPAALPELAVQFGDFAAWQRQWLSGEVLAEQLAWWTGQLGGAPQVVELPLDRPRPAIQSFRGRQADLAIDADLRQRLETKARRLGVTPFMVLLAGFATLLQRYGGQDDVVVGTPIANRGRAELEDLIGFFANTLALHVDLSGDPGFDELARRVREMALGAYARQDVPFERLVDELRPERSLSHSPVFQVTLILQNLPSSHLDLPGLALVPQAADTGRAQFDLSLFFYPRPEGGLLGRLEYASDLFDAATIQRLLGGFHRLLTGVVAEGGEKSRLSALPLMGEEEREQVLHQWNDTASAYPREATIPGLFEEQVRRTPDALAVVDGDEEVTYAELNRRAERLAAGLLAAGVKPDEAVGLCAERSADLIAALLGILKAGGAYVPLDPTYPRERLAGMLTDSRARIVVVQEGFEDALPEGGAARLPLRGTLSGEGGTAARPALHPEQLAYIVFTSGSTGRPKGVAVSHGNVVRLVRETGYAHFGPDEVFLQLAPVAFDASTLEIWGPLLNGGRLAIYPPGPLDLGELGDAVERYGVTFLWLTSGLFHQMVEFHLDRLLPVRHLASGGDVLSPDLMRRALAGLPGVMLTAAYGPTEGTTFTTCQALRSAADLGVGSVSIGRPIANTRVYLLDKTLRPVPVGAMGQLYAAGDGLARGYAERPDLTAERFIPDPVSGEPGARLYATGDLARWRPSGELEFLGRADSQVKIRGFRIELGEIEAVLAAYQEVETALVIAREDVPGDRYLVAYVVAAPGCSPAPVELRRWLEERLPSYMVPAAFVLLSELPLGPTGKVDRRALPAPDASQGSGVEHVAPRNAVEEALAAVWAQVLRREKVGIHDNFFELGGDSIRTIQVVARSRERGVRVSPRQLFQHQTIAGLAAVAEADSPVVAPVVADLPHLDPTELDGILAELGQRSSLTGLDVEDVYPLSPGQQGMLMVVLLAGETEAYFDRSVVTLAGDLDVALWQRAWQLVVDRHPALRTCFVWEGREQPLQVVRRQVELPWETWDWSDLPAAGREARLEGFLRQDSDRRFDLRQPPLMRLSLIRWDEEAWKMIWSFHHLIVDGWSLSRIFGEVVTAYAAFRDGREPALKPPSRYRDYIAWLQRQDLGRAEAFWRAALAGFDEPTPLPYDGTGLSGESWSYGRELSWLPPAGIEALSALARRHQLTLNTLFQGAWGALLARATGRDDVVFGSVVSGRPGEVEGIESVVGFFINVLPVRVQVGDGPMGAALVDLQSRQFEQRDFEYCPLESIQAWSDLPRGSRLMESLLVFQNLPLNSLEMTSLPGFRILDTQISGATHYPLTLYVAPRAGGLDLRLDYHVSRFDAAAARRLLAHLETILGVLTANPEAGMAELPLITAAERLHLLAQAAGPAAAPAGVCIHTLFEEQVARTPAAPAVEAGAMTLTYRELNERAEHLARRLRRLGVGPESIVGLCVERSPEMVVGMLAVLKAGGAYLPLDPAYPRERLAFMVEDSGARVLLARESLADALPTAGREVVLLEAQERAGDDELPGPPSQPGMPANTAYVIYTSGSTGRPKGVLVPHASLVSYVRSAGEDAGIGARDRVLQFASMSFDTSAEEIYPCLTRGATLVLRDEAMAGAAESFLREVERLEITVLDLPTAYWHELVSDDLHWPACVRLVILGGEQARGDRLDVWRERVGERCRLLNTYGPTEATIVTTRRDLNGPRDFPAAVPIGRPVPGARVHVVSRDLGLLPAGLDGELVIGGAGLARGYLGRPDLTAERFVPDPFAGSPGERLYRTGDLGRRLATGELEFRGRTDQQVKVRGFRIELGEIESALRRLAGVREAAALVREERIVVYVVPAGEPAPSPAELRSGLKESLPDYMLPAAFVILEALPLTPSGKIDRRNLPAPEALRTDLDAGSVAPRTPMEELLAGIWSDLLGASDVAPQDSFFDLGGHSLLATRLISRVRSVLGVELSMPAIFEQPTLAGFAALAERARQGSAGLELPPLVRVPRVGPLPASFSQQRLWFLAKLEPASFAYNLAGALRLAGSLDVASLAAALTGVVGRHESLRTTFDEEDGQPLQVIAEPAPHPLPVADLTGLPAAEREREARRIATAEARRPYDLARGPLVRSTLLRLSEREHDLLIGMHHVVSDGWSMSVFVRELGAFYRASVAGEPAALPELAVQYGDFAVWQRQWLSGEVLAEQLAWWTGQLAGAPQVVELPLDRPRPAIQSFRGRQANLAVDADLRQRLETAARRLGVTPFMVLLAGFATLLSRYGGQDDVVVGTPIANRGRAELEDLIGFFANTLALRVDLSGDPGFDELVRRVREMALGAYARQDVPFERLVDELRPERSLSHSPVFQVTLILQNLPSARLDLPGLTLVPQPDDAGRAQFDLSLFFYPRPEGGLLGRLEYASDLFDAATIQRLLDRFHRLLAGVVAEGGERARLSALPLMGEEEREQVLHQWNDTASAYPREATIPGLFAEQVRRAPEAPAVVWGDEVLTYAELDRRAERLAGWLLAAGLQPDEAVGLCAERSADLVAALLGILKAGGAYVPLDPTYPRERLAGMLADTGARIVVVQEGFEDSLPETARRGEVRLPLRGSLAAEGGTTARPALHPEQLAYVSFTSGSTGRPKGVMVSHRNVVRLVRETDYAHFGPDEVFLQLAPVAFDASTLEIWGPLLNGGRLAVYPSGPLDLRELGDALARYGVTYLFLTSGLFHQMVESHLDRLRPLRHLTSGGDVLSPDLVRRAVAGLPGMTFTNAYGPTEGTTFTTCHPLHSTADLGAGSVPIGRPIANTRVYLLDGTFRPVPVGVMGQLYAAGDGLARGYAGRPDLTAERFVPDPVSGEPGARLYATGDLARWRPSGEIEFLGRADAQVKIRGFRIEPGEIEAVLATHPEVETPLVLVREDEPGERRLVAYVVAAPGCALEPAGLRRWLEGRLPSYMMPAAFVALAELPLGPTGKVDRRALPAPAMERREADRPGERNPVEELLAGIWADLLGVSGVAPQESFFELGGHSLLATRMISRVRAVLGVELPIRALFEEPTLAGFAAWALRASQGDAGAELPPLVAVPRGGLLPVLSSQQRLWFLDRLEPGNFAYNLMNGLRLAGSLDVAALAGALSGIVRRHESLRTRFVEEEGEPWQVIAEPAPVPLPLFDLSALPAAAREEEVLRIATEESRRPYDLARGPLVRSALLRLNDREHALLAGMHHIVSDGWSMGIFVRELGELYQSLATGEPARLPALPVQYADFAVWQRQWLNGAVLEEQLAWWTGQLTGAPQVVELPLDRPRPPVQSYRGSRADLRLESELVERLERLTRRLGVTPFMALLSGFAALLRRYGGQPDVVVGTPIANRGHAEVEDLIGFFANTLALRVDLSGDPGFDVLAGRVREVALGAYAHQDFPFERLVNELRPERSLSHSPVFQVMLGLQNLPESGLDLAGLTLSPLKLEAASTQFDLSLSFHPLPRGGMLARLYYARDLFDAATAERLLGHLQTLLQGALDGPEVEISKLPLLTLQERAQLSAWEEETAQRGGHDGLLHGLFEAQARRTPEAVALVAGMDVLSYAELEARSARLADRLRASGLGPEMGVAVCLERTADLVVALLAVLRAGAFYVPLDPRYPVERLRFLLEDSGARVVVTRSRLAAELLPSETPCLLLDGPETAEPVPPQRSTAAVTAQNLAYLIYTSGSTGRPKAVAIQHQSAVELAFWAREAFSPEELRGVLASTAVTFDLSVFEIFIPLAWGGTVVLAENALELPAVAAALPAGVEITLVNTVPSAMAELLREGGLPASVRTLNLAGEALSRGLADQAYARAGTERLCNLYGPSEDTTYSTWTVVERSAERPPSIGRPVHGTRAYVLDAALERLPVGIPGELYLAGAGLARGYLGRPELTAERFLPDLLTEAGGRMYRTGDRVRLRPDGELEYLGRLDHQVKVRGYRIELGEVEAALAAQPGVESSVVLAREDVPGERRLVAYVVAAPEAELEAAELRSALQQTLPEPYIPAAFVFLEALPLTPHGKVDRRALPAPDSSRQGTGVEFVAPRNPVEEALAAVWMEVLRREEIGIHDNFFELGGDSIRTIQVVARSRQRGIRISPRQLFQHQTIAGLAEVAETDSPAVAPLAPVSPFSSLAPAEIDSILAEIGRGSSMTALDVEDVYPVSPGQQGMLMVVLLSGETEAYFDRSVVTLAGDLDAVLWHQAWQRVVDRHPALRTSFIWEGREQPLQVVRRQVELPWDMLDWSDLPAAAREARLEDFLRRDGDRRFDLRNPPLMRFSLIRWDQDTWKMIWSFHHLIVDGWSLSRIFGEAVTAYAAFRDGREPDLGLARHYRDYAAWLRRQDLGRAEAFWRDALAGFDEPTPLPYGSASPGDEVWGYRHEMSWLPPAEVEALSTLARRNQLTLNTVFQGAWGALLARATGRDDVIFGSVVSGRPGEVEGIESIVGFFINVLPVRLTAGGAAVATALANLQSRQFEQRDFEYCPLESIQAWGGFPRGTRLMESLLVFQNFPLNPLALSTLPGFRLVDVESQGATHYPVTLYVAPRAGGFDLRLDYHESHLDASAARQILAHLRTLLTGFVAHPAARLAELPMVTAEELRELLAGAAGPLAPQAGLCIHTLFEEQAARTPEAPAVEAGGVALTYRELNERSGSLARRLRGLGVGPESIVGLCVERSPAMVVGMLAVLKAGGAYLPLDPVYPRERLAFMLEDSGARVLLTQESLAGSLPAAGREVVLLDVEISADDDAEPALAVPRPQPGNGAYVIYTSGSTGRPKGVIVPHASLVSYVRGAGEDAGIGAGDRVLQFASMSFDTSAEEIYPCLTRGATLVLRDDALAGTPESFLREVERRRLTVLDLPTAYWHELVDGLASQGLEWPSCARLVILGGEQARTDRLEVWRQRVGERCRLLNTYGPTEATIVTTRRDLNGPRDFPAAVPIGRPVPGARVHVVSRDLGLLPAGLDGELVIGGAGLARGYLGRPDLTAERFVPDPFAGSPGERLYRTGDLARWLPAGELEFRGRVDHQVKVRGYRIELGEVEAALRAVPGVRDAAAVAREAHGGGRQLVAFVVPREGSVATAGDLRAELQGRLPDFMIPSVFTLLSELPLTPSGKVDRRALERIEAGAGQPDSGVEYVAPRNPVEEILAAVWAEVLRLDRVGIHDNFLELGGDSVLMIQAATRSRQRGVQFTPRQMFQNQTISQLAALADAAGLQASMMEDLLPEGPSQEVLDSVLAELSEEKGFR